MIEINGKFKTWLDKNHPYATRRKTLSVETPIESLDGLACKDIAELMLHLCRVHGEDVVYNERWTGYEDFYPEVITTHIESDEQYQERIKDLKEKYDEEVCVKKEAEKSRRKELEEKMKKLQDELDALSAMR